MEVNKKMNNDDSEESLINIDILYNKKVKTLEINPGLAISSVKKIIYTIFQIDSQKYDLYYRNILLTYEDNNPLYEILGGLVKNPKFAVLPIKEGQSRKGIDPTSVVIYTKIPQEKFQRIVEDYYSSINVKSTPNITSISPGRYIVNFEDIENAQNFKKFYDELLEKKKTKLTKFENNKSYTNLLLCKNKDVSRMFKHLQNNSEHNNSRDSSPDKRSVKNKKSVSPIKLPYISPYKNYINPKDKISYFNSDLFVHEQRSRNYMSPDERYLFEAYIDKKNWINNKNFFWSVGNYSIQKSYKMIPNYVTETPSKPPVLYNHREVNKKKWIDKKGFLK